MSPPSTSLSTILTTNPRYTTAYQAATRSPPFLTRAGQGTLPRELLQQWLAQDRLYAQAYVRFAALLLANVRFPSGVDAEGIGQRQEGGGRVDAGALGERFADLLIDCIVNLRKELKFFENVASRYDLHLDTDEVSEGVRSYRSLFFGVAEGVERRERSFLQGIVVIWGTEKCYLDAWRYAKSVGDARAADSHARHDEDGGILRNEFIPNWSSDEFGKFVSSIENLMDELWTDVSRSLGKEDIELEIGKFHDLFYELLEIERVFWPAVEGSG